MRTALCMAIGLAAAVGGVPASFAQDSGVLDHGKSAGTGSNAGISLAVPIGRVSVDRGSVGGEPVYVRRVTVNGGMTVVEVSTAPFEPVLASNEATPGSGKMRTDQPAG